MPTITARSILDNPNSMSGHVLTVGGIQSSSSLSSGSSRSSVSSNSSSSSSSSSSRSSKSSLSTESIGGSMSSISSLSSVSSNSSSSSTDGNGNLPSPPTNTTNYIVFNSDEYTGTMPLYFTAKNTDLTAQLTNSGSLEQYNSSRWSYYAMPMVLCSDGYYYGLFPPASPNGNYQITIYQQLISTPLATDSSFDTAGSFVWASSVSPATQFTDWLTLTEYHTLAGDILASTLSARHMLGATAPTTFPNDPQIALFISIATDTMSRYIARTIASTSYAQVYNSWAGYSLDLMQFPVTTLTSVIFDFGGLNPQTIPGTEFNVSSTGELRFNYNSLYKRGFFGQIQVNFIAGQIIPPALKGATFTVVQSMLRMSDANAGVTAQQDKNVRVEYNRALFDIKSSVYATVMPILASFYVPPMFFA